MTAPGARRTNLLLLVLTIAAYWGAILQRHLAGMTPGVASTVDALMPALGVLLAMCALVELRRRHSEVELRLAFYDELTGLLNRRALHELVGILAERGRGMSLLLCDVDGLKPINDECGHQAGDELIRRVGVYLKQTTRGGSHVFRIGGDEFAVLFRGPVKSTRADLRRCVQPFVATFGSCGHSHMVSLSSGFAAGRKGESYDALFSKADGILRETKDRLYGSGFIANPRRRPRRLRRVEPPRAA